MINLAIIFTTFLRDELMKKTLNSITKNWIDNSFLLIANQNIIKQEEKPLFFYEKDSFDIVGQEFYVGYDCGLSYARNYLVQKAYEMHIPYCLISADSIEFTDKYNFEPIIEFIQKKDNNAIVGLQLNNRQPFEYDMRIDRELGKFVLSKPSRVKIIYKGIHYQQCDIVKNFFIAPTELLVKYKWNNELHLCEHETFMMQLKENNVNVYFTNYIQANYIDEKPKEYKVMRNRMYGEFLTKMREINGMYQNPTGWIEYEH